MKEKMVIWGDISCEEHITMKIRRENKDTLITIE